MARRSINDISVLTIGELLLQILDIASSSRSTIQKMWCLKGNRTGSVDDASEDDLDEDETIS